MVFIALYPGVALVAMLVIIVIMVMLRHGPKLCGLQHSLVGERRGYVDGSDGAAYDHRISVA